MKIKVVEFYKNHLIENSFLNFLKNKSLAVESFWFREDKRADPKFLSRKKIIVYEIRNVFLLLRKIGTFRNKKVICFGGHYSLLFITRLFSAFLGREYHLYAYNFYIHGLGKKNLVKAILKFLLHSRSTTLIVQSHDELIYYSRLSKNKIFFIPYCEDSEYSVDCSRAPDGKYLFTGGYTNRDYSLILECAKQNPAIKFVIVKSKLNTEIQSEDISNNVILFEEIDALIFNGLLFKSYAVIVPLKENVGASGQMLTLKAMKMAKPVIYCDISSINYYFADNSCGIPYELGSLESLNAAITKLFSRDFDIAVMGKNAQKYFKENFTMQNRNKMLLDVILENGK